MVARQRWWSQLVAIAKPLFTRDGRWRTLAMAAVIVALLFGLNGLNVANSYVGRGFMTALARREVAEFYTFALYYVSIFAASTVVAVFYQFCQDRLALFWREKLTRHFLAEYLSGQAYYRLHFQKEVDNPDERITEDVRNFSTTLLSFSLVILNATLTVLAFAGILWSIAPRLFIAAVIYAAGGSLVTIFLGYRLVGLNFLDLASEAELRYGLVRIRVHSEPIDLLHGEAEEERQVRNRLDQVVAVVKRIIAVNRNIGFFTSLFNYLIPILPVILVAPLYLRGEIEFGEVTQSAMAFAQFLGGLTVLITQFQNISAFAAVVSRLGALEQTIQKVQQKTDGTIQITHDSTRIAYDKLTLRTPGNGRLLIKELSFEIPAGRRLLVNGIEGAGKTALFRATAGLWSEGEGRIVCPEFHDMMFLPHEPYTLPGTLRDLILYGIRDRNIPDARMLEVLHQVKFDDVIERVGGLEVECDWAVALSAGEQQLLGFVRLLLANPRFAFLDRAISSLSSESAKNLYQILSHSSITYLSVGDHARIQEYHDWVLDLFEDGGWKLKPAIAASGRGDGHVL